MQIGSLEDIRKRVLQSVTGLQNSYRGHKARSQFLELKAGASALQSCEIGSFAAIIIIF